MQLTAEAVYDRIIWSADVDDDDAMLSVVDYAPSLTHIKVDRLYVARNGYRIFDELTERGRMAFYDAKCIEIPSKLAGLAETECRHHPWMLNCMAGSVSGHLLDSEDPDKVEGLKRFADACHAAGVRPCAVTVLTSKQPPLFEENGEFNGRTSQEQVLYYAEFLLTCGFTDMVCSPEEVPVIRAESRFDVLDLDTPGIRRATSAIGAQGPPHTPASAVPAGATRLVIGRDITKRGNPTRNLKDIVDEVIAA